MGLSSTKTQTTSKEKAVTQPNTPSYVTPAITDYFGQVSDFGNQIAADPSMFATPANSTQLGAVDAANNLGGWQSGLNDSTAMANTAGNTQFAPVNTTNASAAQLGPASQATAASIFDTPIENYLNPATNQLVDTTLAGFDDNSGRVRAQQQADAARGGAFGGSRYGIAQAQTEADLARERASTEAGLRFGAFDRATNLAATDAGYRQQTGLFNTDAKNNYGLTQGGFDQQANILNAGNANDNARFNAQQQQQQVANMLSAAGITSGNATAGGNLAQQDVATQMAAGNSLYDIQQQNNLAPLTSLAAYQGLLDPSLIAALTGQTITSEGNSTTKQGNGLLGQILGGLVQAGGTALMSERRVKRDIEQIDTMPDGLGVYQFNYLWDEPEMDRRIGVMVDEVETLRPWALGPMIDGVQTVDYGRL